MNIRSHRYAGISLGGGKNDRTSVAIIEYFPSQKRIFLRHLKEKVKPDGEISADQVLHKFLTKDEPDIDVIGFDVPTQLPKCLRCRLRCPGHERCKQTEIKWLWENHRKRAKDKKTTKIFTPYTERCVDAYLQTELEEPFHPGHAMGANLAPLTARAYFILRRLKTPTYEVFLPAAIWRIGRHLSLGKNLLREDILTVAGEEARTVFLDAILRERLVFLYQQDYKTLIDSLSAFNAFVVGIVTHLAYTSQCEKRPVGFPRSEAWVQIPKKEFMWFG